MITVKLTWEKGLPFSLDDIVIIERALSKRQLEYVDREVENEKDFEKRIKLMEELEAQQWADREKVIHSYHTILFLIYSKLQCKHDCLNHSRNWTSCDSEKWSSQTDCFKNTPLE